MFWILFSLFLIVSLGAEIYIYKKHIIRTSNKTVKRLYLTISIALWSLLGTGFLYFYIALDPPHFMMRIFSLLIPIFLMSEVSKIIYFLMSWLGGILKLRNLANAFTLLFIIVTGSIVLYGTTIGRSTIRVEEVEVFSDRIPEGFDGFKIALFADLHVGVIIGRESIAEQLVSAINKLEADLVVNAGDIVNNDYRELDERMLEILSKVKSNHGVFSVLGNHDSGVYIKDSLTLSASDHIDRLTDRINSIGWHLLRDEHVEITRNGDTITLTGIDFPEELLHSSHGVLSAPDVYNEVYETSPRDRYNITISHSPRVWHHLVENEFSDLTLCGHIHGLQLKLKLGKRQWSPARLFYKEWSGLYTDKGRHLYINDGIGYGLIPMRIWCKPEVTLLTLRRE